MTEDYKVDPRTIHIDQRKKDVRRDAWDRDYMGYHSKKTCLLYTSPSPRDQEASRMPSSA